MKFSLTNPLIPLWLERSKKRILAYWQQARLPNKEPKPEQIKTLLMQWRALFVKKRPEGMAALSVQPDGVALVHLIWSENDQEKVPFKPRLQTCVFQPFSKDQSPHRIVERLVKEHKLEHARFTTVLNREHYTLFPADLPDVPRAEWATAMRWRIKDQIDFPIAQAVLEVFDMPGTFADKESGRIYVAATRESVIKQQVELFIKADLELYCIDILELALRNLTTKLQDDQEGMAMLYLEAQFGIIMVLKRGKFFLARQIDIGLEALLESLTDLGEDDDGNPLGIANSHLVDSIALEAQRTMDYFESHFNQTSALSLHIAPMTTSIPGFRRALTTKLGMRIKYLPMEEILEIPANTNEMDLARCLPAIGAAMRRSKNLS